MFVNVLFPLHIPSRYKNYHYNYVIHAESFKHFIYIFNYLQDYNIWHPKLTPEGKLVLITIEEELEKKITALWNIGVINLIVLVYYDSSKTMRILTSDPQAPKNNCGLNLKEYLTVADCFDQTSIRLPKNLRKYTNCNVTHMDLAGTDRYHFKLLKTVTLILKLIVERLNMFITIHNMTNNPRDYDIFTVSVQYRGLLSGYSCSSVFFVDDMVWMVPFSKQIPPMKTLLVVFKKNVWYYVLVSFVGTSLAWWLMTKVISRASSISEAFLKVFSITLFGSVDKFSLFWSMRCLFLAYVLYSIHIQTAFTSRLIEILTIPQYEPRIKSLTELANSQVTVYVSHNIYEHFFDHQVLNSTLYNKIKKRIVKLNDWIYHGIVYDKNTYTKLGSIMSGFEFEMLTKTHLMNFNTIDGSSLIGNLETVFGGMKNSYFVRTIDEFIIILNESGILRYLVDNIKIDLSAQTLHEDIPVLSLEHVYSVFVFWGGDEPYSDLNKCIAKTIETVFPSNETVIYVYYDEEMFSITDNNPYVVINIQFPLYKSSNYKNYHYNYIIHAESFNHLLYAFNYIQGNKLWHPKLMSDGKLLLITIEEELEKKITALWNTGLINLIVLVYYDSSKTMRILTSDPQAPKNNCGLNLKEYLTVADCFDQTSIRLPKKYRKYTNCNVTHMDLAGTNRYHLKLMETVTLILDLFVERLGISLTIYNSNNNDRVFDIFTIYVHYRALFPDNAFTAVFFSDNMVWIVPFSKQIPPIKILQVVFKQNVWICVLVSFVGTSLVWWLMTKVISRTSSISEAFLKVFSITLFGSVDKFDLLWSMKCLFLAYVLYSIHIQTAFTSRLIEILTIPQYEPRIESLTELANSQVTVYVSHNIYEHFFDHQVLNSTLYNKIKKRIVKLNDWIYHGIVYDKSTYLILGSIMSGFEFEMLTKTQRMDFNTIDGSSLIGNLDTVFGGMKNSYFVRTIDEFIIILSESGNLRYLVDHIKIEFTTQTLHEDIPVLSLQHVFPVFVFWGVGLLLSVVVLIFEFIYFYVPKYLNCMMRCIK
ncbi:hypothetical protein FQR65_LT07841 [Abscondita terminalis]|nr:hypothetical protein FQR65_LT07841 [Abscondita terminalis]